MIHQIRLHKTKNESNGEPIDKGYVSDLPDDLKFPDQFVGMLIKSKTGFLDEFYSEQTGTGDVIMDAVFDRNLAVEESLGITINVTAVEEVQSAVKLEAAGATGDYQVFVNMTNNGIGSVMAGDVQNIADLPNLDMEKKYWSQGFNDLASYGTDGAQYLICGAPSITLYRYLFVTIYNKEYFEQRGWENLYSVVDRGEWTFEYQSNLIKDTWLNTDDDPAQSEGDFYGFVSGDCVSVDPYLVASDIQIIEKNSDGEWEWNGDVEEPVVNMVEAIQNLYYHSNGAYIFETSTYDDTGLTFIIDKFAEKQAAMATTQLFGIERSIGKVSEIDFGIVPMPKMSVDDDYQSYVQDQVTSYGVIKSVTEDKYSLIGAFFDELAYQSYNIVVPEYYERTLSKKFMKDPESQDMLDQIYESIKFDFVGAFSAILSPAVRDQMRLVVASDGSTGVSSEFAKWGKSIKRTLNGTVNNKLDQLS